MYGGVGLWLLGSRQGGRCHLQVTWAAAARLHRSWQWGLLCFEEQDQGLMLHSDGTCSGFHGAIVEVASLAATCSWCSGLLAERETGRGACRTMHMIEGVARRFVCRGLREECHGGRK